MLHGTINGQLGPRHGNSGAAREEDSRGNSCVSTSPPVTDPPVVVALKGLLKLPDARYSFCETEACRNKKEITTGIRKT